jgi:hypothetical protein
VIWRTLAAIAAVTLTVGSAACNRDEAAVPASTAVPTPSPDAAPPVTLVSLADLRASVPEFRGWTRGEMTAQEGTDAQRSTQVLTTFTRGNEKLELELADTGGAPRAIESLEQMAGSTTNRTVGNGYFKGTMLAGFPAVESWNTVEKVGELSVLIRRRYIIHVAGSGLADAAPMRALAEAVDTSRLR